MVHCFTYETERPANRRRLWTRRGENELSDAIWETFDSLFKTVHRQGRRVEELEARVVELERRLETRAARVEQVETRERVSKMPAEKAA